MGFSFDCSLIDDSLCQPLADGSFLQKVSMDVTVMRDQHLQKVIEKMLNQFNRILIIYGRAHPVIYRKVLESYFGAAKFIK